MVACCWSIPIMLAPVLPPREDPPSNHSDTQDDRSPQNTMFRAWTWPLDTSSAEEPVPGLHALLCSIGLSSFYDAADLWCRQQGAAFLTDLMEQTEFDDFVCALKQIGRLSPSMERRLNLALQSANQKCGKSHALAHQRRTQSCQCHKLSGSFSSRVKPCRAEPLNVSDNTHPLTQETPGRQVLPYHSALATLNRCSHRGVVTPGSEPGSEQVSKHSCATNSFSSQTVQAVSVSKTHRNGGKQMRNQRTEQLGKPSVNMQLRNGDLATEQMPKSIRESQNLSVKTIGVRMAVDKDGTLKIAWDVLPQGHDTNVNDEWEQKLQEDEAIKEPQKHLPTCLTPAVTVALPGLVEEKRTVAPIRRW